MTLVNDPTVWAVSNASMKSLIMGKRARSFLGNEILDGFDANGDQGYC